MPTCAHCGLVLDDLQRACPSCGQTPGKAPATAPGASRPAGGAGLMVAVALAGLLIGAAGVALVTSRAFPAAATVPSPEAHAPVEAVDDGVAPVPEYSGPPKWSPARRSGLGRDATLAYDLPAEQDVRLWGKRVRPVLTVRCLAGATEVFVLTESAASLENTEGTHTVRIGFDGGPIREEKWLASADYDALFAADGAVAARQISAARAMRFGFTPYNSSSVVAQFDVRGFDRLIGSVSQACR
jgi:hypothetical protein